MHHYHLSNFLSWLIIKNKSVYPTFEYKYLTKPILAHVKLLLSYNLINGYRIDSDEKISDNSRITIFLKYDSINLKPVLKKIKFFSRPGCYRYIDLKRVKHLVAMRTHNSSLFVLSTSSGVLTANECLKKRTGGLLLYHITA